MKRKIKGMLLITMVFTGLLFNLTGCQKLMEQEKVEPGKTVGEEVYTGFDTIPSEYTYKQAVADGCLVYKQNKLVAGKDKWDEFVKKCQGEEPAEYAKIRIRQVVGEDDIYYEDLIFKNGKYRLIVSTNPEEYDYTYDYLIDLTGKASKKMKSSRYVLITNDKEISFEDVLSDEAVSKAQRKHDYQMIFHE